MIGRLPKSIDVGGVSYDIRTDFRDVLTILCAYDDPDLNDVDKGYTCLKILYKDFEDIPSEHIGEAIEKAIAFINCGKVDKNKQDSPKTVDWVQDEQLIFPAINKVAGFETRSAEYIHWWTFMGYYMEISEGVFSRVVMLRNKRAKGKQLEKDELEFWNANTDICVLRTRLSEEEQREKDNLIALIGG